VENHSAVEPPGAGTDRDAESHRSPLEYAAENWDAPIIVTTSVQFLESLFASSPSRCRKLHNVARSVVILDEVQTLPTHLLSPVLNVFRELQKNYGVTFVFSSATQPAFRRSSALPDGFDEHEITEIAPDPPRLFTTLARVRYSRPAADGKLSWPEMAERLASSPRCLCVVNVRKHAFELWQAMVLILRDGEDRASLFHLSSAMCAQHRLDVLAEIRSRLDPSNPRPCRVVSTQLVEAGVDLDFPIVYRALGPLDSIVQAAGRCNREGRLHDASGRKVLGEVVVFKPAEDGMPRGVYHTATGLTAGILSREKMLETLSADPAVFSDYFGQLHALVPTDHERSGTSSIQHDRGNLRFRQVAAKAHVIEQDTRAIVVSYEKGGERIEDVRRRQWLGYEDYRRLQRYMVNLRDRDFRKMLELRLIEPLLKNIDLFVLLPNCYHPQPGMIVDNRPSEDFVV